MRTAQAVQVQSVFQQLEGPVASDPEAQAAELALRSAMLRSRIRDMKRIFAFYSAMGGNNSKAISGPGAGERVHSPLAPGTTCR